QRSRADPRHGGPGGGGRGGRRRQPRSGRPVPLRQDADVRLVRGPGDEENGRARRSGGGARGADARSRSLRRVIELFGVTKKYGTFRDALVDVSFRIDPGEFVFLTGPSGAGKSTLLRLLFLEEPPSAGQIIVNGRNIGVLPQSQIPYLRRTMGVLFH